MSFQVEVVSPEGVVWQGEADELIARTTEGEIGILTDHEPLLASLATGAVVVKHGDGEISIGVHGGLLQLWKNQVTILTDVAELAVGDRESARKLASELKDKTEEALG